MDDNWGYPHGESETSNFSEIHQAIVGMDTPNPKHLQSRPSSPAPAELVDITPIPIGFIPTYTTGNDRRCVTKKRVAGQN